MLIKITKDELKVILDNHKLWLGDNTKGKQANLRSANLRSANLSYANLRSADLRSANLSYADLRSADLRYANLSYADLSYADLRYANLSYADLSYADLRYADLSYADLRYADLSKHYYQVSCIGSRKGMTTYCMEDDYIWCGCWHGKMDEFEKRVKETHKDNKQWLEEYKQAIKFFKSMKKAVKK